MNIYFDNNTFRARLNFSSDASKSFFSNRMQSVKDIFEKDTKGMCDNVTMDIMEFAERQNLFIFKDTNYHKEFYVLLKDKLYKKFKELSDSEMVDKIKRIMNLSENNEEYYKTAVECAKKLQLDGEALETFNEAVRIQSQKDIAKRLAKDKFFEDAEFYKW